MPGRQIGIITWASGANPFMCITSQRDSGEPGASRQLISMSASCRDGILRLVDSEHSAYYEEALAGTGANLISARMDIVLCSLMYPAVFDGFRSGDGTITDEFVDNIPVKRLVVQRGPYRLDLTVDAATMMPLRIERSSPGSGAPGAQLRYICELGRPRVSALRPPEEIFNVNSMFGFERRRHEPTGLLGRAAPSFSVQMLDGSVLNLQEQRGRWVFLFFHSEEERSQQSGPLYVERAGDRARAAGAVFIDVYSQSGDSIGPAKPYKLQHACKSDVLMRMYGVNRAGLPLLVLIDPEGNVRELMIGFIPGLGERALDRLLEPLEAASRIVSEAK